MKNIKGQNQIFNWIKFFPVFMFVVISPLIVRYKKIEYDELDQLYWTMPHNVVHDFFNYNKSQFIIASGIVALLFLVGWYIFKGFKWNRVFWYIVGLFACVLLSSSFSDYQSFVWEGYPQKMQGAWVWITYLIMIVYISQIVENSEDGLRLGRIVMISACIITGIGLFQTLGFDFFRSDSGVRYLLGDEMYKNFMGKGQSISFNFPNRQAYSVLYNPNYVGSYVSILIPLCFGGVKFEKSKVLKAVWIIIGVGALMMLIGSKSRGGLIGVVIAMSFYGLVTIKQGILDKKKGMIVVSAVLICGIGMILFFGNTVSERLSSMFDIKNENTSIRSIDSYSDRVEFDFKSNQKMIIQVVNDNGNSQLKIIDEYGKDLKLAHSIEGNYDQVLGFEENVFVQPIKLSEEDGFNVIIGESSWPFVYLNREIKFMTPTGKLGDIKTTHTKWGNLETLGSNRGYIWTRALPITKLTLFLGKGPDTFSLEFPQNDYLKKEILYGTKGIIVDKAHNGYIGMALELGWLCVLIFISFHYHLIRNICKNSIAVFLAAGLVGGLVVKVFNDFNIHTMFLHVVVIGIAISMNIQRKEAS